MASLAPSSESPPEVTSNTLLVPLSILLCFFLFSADVVSLLLGSPLWLPFSFFFAYVFVRLVFDILAFYRILPPHLQIAHFMFPRIPHDPVTFYLVPDPIPPPIDTERLLSHIDWQVSLDKFHRDRAAIQERLVAKADEAKAKKKEKEEREAKGDFGPMDERCVY